jgi:predicted HicB family RNase H-like nuclease
MDTMEYKGYRGAVRYSAEDRLLHGRILGIADVVGFEGTGIEDLEKAFREAVDDYLTLCAKLGREPDREYSGRIPLRIDADLHRCVAIAADSQAKSVNAWIADALEAATSRAPSDAARRRKTARRKGR